MNKNELIDTFSNRYWLDIYYIYVAGYYDPLKFQRKYIS